MSCCALTRLYESSRRLFGIWFEVTLTKRLRSGFPRLGDEASPTLVIPHLVCRMLLKRVTSSLLKPSDALSAAQAAACDGSAQLLAVRKYGLANEACFTWRSVAMKKCALSLMIGPPTNAPNWVVL